MSHNETSVFMFGVRLMNMSTSSTNCHLVRIWNYKQLKWDVFEVETMTLVVVEHEFEYLKQWIELTNERCRVLYSPWVREKHGFYSELWGWKHGFYSDLWGVMKWILQLFMIVKTWNLQWIMRWKQRFHSELSDGNMYFRVNYEGKP